MLKHWYFEGLLRLPEDKDSRPFKILITKPHKVLGTGCQKKLNEFDFTEFDVVVHSWPVFDLNALPTHGSTSEEARAKALELVTDLLSSWKIVIMDGTGKPASLKDLKTELI